MFNLRVAHTNKKKFGNLSYEQTESFTCNKSSKVIVDTVIIFLMINFKVINAFKTLGCKKLEKEAKEGYRVNERFPL